MTNSNEESPRPVQAEGFDRASYPISPKDTAPAAKRKRRKRGRSRCVCAMYGVQACEECRGIDARRRAANEGRNR